MSLVSAAFRFIRKFFSLLQEPQANARLIVVMLGILIVIALGLIILGYLFGSLIKRVLYTQGRGGSPEASTDHPFASSGAEEDRRAGEIERQTPLDLMEREKPQYFRLALLAGTVIGGTLALMIAGGIATSGSEFCGKACHSMNPDYQSWRRSSHAQVACVSCHNSGNIISSTRSRYSAAVNIFKEISGRYDRPINAASDHGEKNMDDSVCVGCHLLSDKPTATGLSAGAASKVYGKHRQAGLKCVTCHNRVAHPRAEKYDPLPGKDKTFKYLDYMKMKNGCLRCHQLGGKFVDGRGKIQLGPYKAVNGATAKTRCSLCHDKAEPESVVKVHGDITVIHLNARKYGSEPCLFCHGSMTKASSPYHRLHLSASVTELKCASCHKKIEGGLRSAAGKLVVDRRICVRCHVDKFDAYTPKHRKRTWAATHRSLRGIDKGPCFSCHKYKELKFCDDCHKAHPHNDKWVNGGHGRRALSSVPRSQFKTGPITCDRCHDRRSWCTTRCHKGITVPHNTVRVWHRDEVRQDRERCRMCHKDQTGLNFCGKRCHHTRFIVAFGLDKNVPWRNGKSEHGVVARATGGQPCFRCHEQKTWCTTQCHRGITMPHAPNWRDVHFTFVKYDINAKHPALRKWKYKEAACNMCHNKDGNNSYYCFNCHHKEFYEIDPTMPKGSKRSIMRLAARRFGTTPGLENTERCAKCHDVRRFCTNCHGGYD